MCIKKEQGLRALSRLAVTEQCQAEPHMVMQRKTERQYLAV